MVACTATASDRTAEEIIHVLRMNAPTTIRMPMSRTNLHLNVVSKRGTSKDQRMLVDVVRMSSAKHVIVFCLEREECERVASLFVMNKISAQPYHSCVEDRHVVEENARSGTGSPAESDMFAFCRASRRINHCKVAPLTQDHEESVSGEMGAWCA